MNAPVSYEQMGMNSRFIHERNSHDESRRACQAGLNNVHRQDRAAVRTRCSAS